MMFSLIKQRLQFLQWVTNVQQSCVQPETSVESCVDLSTVIIGCSNFDETACPVPRRARW
jgi:hypothetical protein